MDWQALVGGGWQRHADDAAGVVATLRDALDTTPPADQAPAIAALVVHVAGEHLGRWDDGLALLDRLAAPAGSAEARAVARSRAVLHRCRGDEAAAAAAVAEAVGDAFPDASHHARVDAIAASAIAAQRDLARAAAYFARAVRDGGDLPDGDPAVRALAITANNLAVALEESPDRGPAGDALLRDAARAARGFWARAGTWINVERAEYRLAKAHLALGEPAVALRHAKACLAIVEEHDGDALERLFAHEAIARARHAGGDVSGARADAARAADCLDAIADAGTRRWCAGEIDRLRRDVGA